MDWFIRCRHSFRHVCGCERYEVSVIFDVGKEKGRNLPVPTFLHAPQ